MSSSKQAFLRNSPSFLDTVLSSSTTPVNLLGKDTDVNWVVLYIVTQPTVLTSTGEFMAFLLYEPPTANFTAIQGQFGEERVV